MSKNKKSEITIRSSAAEYLSFVAATGSGESSMEMRYVDENIWLTQKMMATLYDVSVPAINQHLKRIYEDKEITREATVKKYLTVQTEGQREVKREVDHYSLQAIIAVGFKIEKYRIVQDRLYVSDFDKQIHALETLKNKTDPKGEQATVNPKLTVQKQAKKESRKKGGEA
jgi:hypothetical protein